MSTYGYVGGNPNIYSDSNGLFLPAIAVIGEILLDAAAAEEAAAAATASDNSPAPAADAGGAANKPPRNFWKNLNPCKGKTKNNGQTGKKRRYYEWDFTHGDVEVYDRNGNHLGSADPETGEMTKPAVPGRSIGL